MDKNQNDFDEIESASAEKRRVQSFDDLQNELSGNEVGRIQRFLSSDASALLNEKRNGKNSSKMSAFDVLMMDSAYANLYDNAMGQLGNAERATDDAIIEWTEIAEQTAADVGDTLDRAYFLDDGRHVFRDAQDIVWDENKLRIDENLAETIEWTGLEPSYEEYLARLAADNEAQSTLTELRIYQTDVLGAARERLTDTEHPLSADEIEAELQTVLSQAPDATQLEVSQTATSENEAHSFNIAAPQL